MFQSPNNTFDTLLKKLRQLYQQINVDDSTTVNKTNSLNNTPLEKNNISPANILDDTGDIPLVPSELEPNNISPDAYQPLNTSYFYSKIFTNFSSKFLPFLEYETSFHSGPNKKIAPIFIYPTDGYTTNYLQVLGDSTLLIQGIPDFSPFISPDPKVFTVYDADVSNRVVVTQAHIDAGNVLASHCQLQSGGPLNGYYLVYYDTGFIWPLKIFQAPYGYDLTPFPEAIGLQDVPFNFTGFSTLPYTILQVKTNPDPYPVRLSAYFGDQPSDFVKPNFQTSTPIYFRTSKSTDNQENWQVNLFYTALILTQGTIVNLITYPQQDDTYTQTSGPFGDLTEYSYTDTIQNHGTIDRNTYSPSLDDITTRVRVALRSSFNAKENKKFNTEVS